MHVSDIHSMVDCHYLHIIPSELHYLTPLIFPRKHYSRCNIILHKRLSYMRDI